MKNHLIKSLVILLCLLIFSCHDDKDKNALIKGQIIYADDIIVYNANSDLTKGEGFTSNYNIFLRITDKGIQFEPTKWNSKANFVYGTTKEIKQKDGKLIYDFDGKFMRSKSENSAVNTIYDCFLKAEIDTISKTCDVIMVLDIDSLIFQMKYK